MIQFVRKCSCSSASSSSGSNSETDITGDMDISEQSSILKKPKWQLTVATFKKWQQNYERDISV